MADFLFILTHTPATCGKAAHTMPPLGGLAGGSSDITADLAQLAQRSRDDLRLSRSNALATASQLQGLLAAGGSLGKQLTAIKQQTLDVGLRTGDAIPIGSRLFPGLTSQLLQLLLQGGEALLHRHQPMRKGMQGFRQILGMATDPERHRWRGHGGWDQQASAA